MECIALYSFLSLEIGLYFSPNKFQENSIDF